MTIDKEAFKAGVNDTLSPRIAPRWTDEGVHEPEPETPPWWLGVAFLLALLVPFGLSVWALARLMGWL